MTKSVMRVTLKNEHRYSIENICLYVDLWNKFLLRKTKIYGINVSPYYRKKEKCYVHNIFTTNYR